MVLCRGGVEEICQAYGSMQRWHGGGLSGPWFCVEVAWKRSIRPVVLCRGGVAMVILGNSEAEVGESRCKSKRTFLPEFTSQNITESNFLLDLGKCLLSH